MPIERDILFMITNAYDNRNDAKHYPHYESYVMGYLDGVVSGLSKVEKVVNELCAKFELARTIHNNALDGSRELKEGK